MTVRVCIESGCPALTRGTRCTEHERAKDKARGTAAQRGYDQPHRTLRADWQRRLDAGLVVHCWRCAECDVVTIIDPKAWTLGHCDDDRSTYHGPECPPCDYATSGRTICPHGSHAA